MRGIAMATADIKEADDEIVDHTKPPFLRRVRIRGYKSIAFCDVTLEPLTVLVGRNGAGKSNFLDALAFLRDAMDVSVTEAVKRHGGWAGVACRTADFPFIEFEIEAGFLCRPLHVSSVPVEAALKFEGRGFVAKYLLQVSGGEHRPAVIEREKLDLLDDRGEKFAFDVRRPSPESEKMEKSGLGPKYMGSGVTLSSWSPTSLTDASEQFSDAMSAHRPDHCALAAIGFHPYIDLADTLRSMVFNNMQPGTVRPPQAPSNGSLLEKDASNLASVIRCLKDVDPASLNRVKQYVCHIVEEVSDFWVEAIGEYETIRFRMRSERNGKPIEFDARSMSDGTLRVLANIIAAYQNVPPFGRPSVVGIEEPETSLHPRAVNALVDALDEATLRTQVLLTTHSVELLDNPTIQPKNVRVVEMVDGKTIIGPVDSASVEIVQRKLNTLGGLERENQLEADLDDRERQDLLWKNGQEPHQ
jgi:predicted ATPase